MENNNPATNPATNPNRVDEGYVLLAGNHMKRFMAFLEALGVEHGTPLDNNDEEIS